MALIGPFIPAPARSNWGIMHAFFTSSIKKRPFEFGGQIVKTIDPRGGWADKTPPTPKISGR